MSDLIFKEFNGQQVRTKVDEKGDVWFVSQDVMSILEIKYQHHAMRKLEDYQRGLMIFHTPGGKQQLSVVNESGLYALVFASKKKEAKAFQRWITNEVIPSIRKTGTYSTLPAMPAIDADPLDRLEVMVQVMREQRRIAAQAVQKVDELALQVVAVAQEAKQDNDTLTHDQISKLDQLMNTRYKMLACHPKVLGLMKRAIKQEFFELGATRTYKEIPRSGFDRAMQIVAGFVPPSNIPKNKPNSTRRASALAI